MFAQSMISRRYRAAVIFQKYPMEGECADERELLPWMKTMFMRFASIIRIDGGDRTVGPRCHGRFLTLN